MQVNNECGSGNMEEDEGVKGKGETVTEKYATRESNAREKRKERKRERAGGRRESRMENKTKWEK